MESPRPNPSPPIALVAWASAACLGCRYPLGGMPAGVCPECGRGFDPGDPETVGPRPSWAGWRWIGAAAWLCSPGLLYGSLGIGVMYLLAWMVLGRPPVAHADDPKGIAIVGMLHSAVVLAIVLAPLLTGLAVVLACFAAAFRDRWWLLIPPVLTAVVSWPIALFILWLYPATLLTWWWD